MLWGTNCRIYKLGSQPTATAKHAKCNIRTYITSLGYSRNDGEGRGVGQSVKAKNATTKRSGLITQQTINYFTEMRRERKRRRRKKREVKEAQDEC